MAEQPLGSQTIDNRVYIGPNKTGDNIDANRAANYSFGSDSNWSRSPLPLVDVPYDEIALSSYDANGIPATIEFKSGGVTARTLSLTVDGNGNITDILRS